MDSFRFSNSYSSRTTGFLSSFRVQSKGFFLLWNNPLKIIHFFPCSRILIDQKCEKVLLFWPCLDIQTHISLLLYLLYFPSEIQSIVLFLLEAEFWFLNIMKIVLYIGNKMLMGHKWQKCY